jgi:hypothetical protein
LNIIYKYNEKKYVDKILKNGFINKFYLSQLKVLGKYYKDIGFKNKEIKERIYKFCEKYIQEFNRAKYFKTINSVMNYLNKKTSNLVVIEEVKINEFEINYINKLNLDYDFKKLLFTILVFNKLNKIEYKIRTGNNLESNYFISNELHKDIQKSSGINKNIDFDDYVFLFGMDGLVTSTHKGRFYLNFVDDIEKEFDNQCNSENSDKYDDEYINKSKDLIIFDYNNIGCYFDVYNNKKNNFIKCNVCGMFIKKTSNSRKYCEDCSIEIQKKHDRNYQKVKYHSRLVEKF